MQKTEYFCDHCGKLLNEEEDYLNAEITIGNELYVEADLCEDCITKLSDYAAKFIDKII